MQLRRSKHDLNIEWKFGNKLDCKRNLQQPWKSAKPKAELQLLKTQAINGYTISHFTLQCASVLNSCAGLHLQIISLFANTAELMLMPQDLIVSKSGNSKWRVINQ